MASRIQATALCVFCFEQVDLEDNFDKFLSIRPNLLLSVTQRRADFVDLNTKKDGKPEYREELRWEKDKHTLSPVAVGYGPCKACAKTLPATIKDIYKKRIQLSEDRREHEAKAKNTPA